MKNIFSKLSLPKTVDWLLYLIPIILTLAGLAVIYSLTYYNDKIYLFYDQLIYAALGIVLMVALTFFDYRNLKGLAVYLYIIGIILLVLVLFLGKTALGATRWLNLGIFQLQPAELMKVFLILISARYLSDKIGELKLKDIIIAFVLALIPMVLVLRQPDLGTASVIFIGTLAVLVGSKLKKIQLIIMLAVLLISIPAGWFFLKDYQKERLYTFINPAADKYGSGYNVLQSMITVGNGGLVGRGLGHGPQSQLNFLPIAHTDFVFAGFAEATGFLGSTVLIGLYILLTTRIIKVAKISKDSFGMLLAIGFAAIIFFQMAVNIGMNLGLLPVTGIPLPFASQGGTSLILNFGIIGILQSIYLRHKKISF